jgi:hypothetical protein
MVHYISVRKLLKYLPTGEVANLVGVTPAYVSQVKHGWVTRDGGLRRGSK